MFVDNIILNM